MSKNYKDKAKQKRKEAEKLMTKDQLKKCHAIIHTAAVASGTAGAIPIPVADALPISASQITMVLSLGKVFGKKLTKSAANSLLVATGSTIVGRNLVKLIPIAGWIASAGVAASVTEAMGWAIAVDFARPTFADGYKKGCEETSKVYEAKFTEQAKEFVKQEEEWIKTDKERDRTEEKMKKFNEECLKYIRDLEKERDALRKLNKTLSREKEDLLEKLYKLHPLMLA